MPGPALALRQNPWLAYGFALVIFALAFLVRWMAASAMDGLPFVTFFLAILAVAAFAGTGPAVLCLTLCFVAAWYFFLPPFVSFRLLWPQGPIALGAFILVGAAQIILVHRLRTALEHLEEQKRELAMQAGRHSLLYQELQHRVANGIQSVASSLSVQASLSPEAQPALDEAADRLRGVAEVHRRLHDPALGDRLGDMLDGLLRQLLVSADKSAVAVSVTVEVEKVPPEIASLIGMIVAEAAANSIKYAFAGRFGGSFEVGLLRAGADRLRLEIEDDGPGFQADRLHDDSLGMTIIQGFAQRLGGTARFGEGKAGGARVALEFPFEIDKR